MSGSLGAACGVSGLSEGEYRLAALPPLGPGAPLYMANNDWVVSETRYMYGDWAEESLLQAFAPECPSCISRLHPGSSSATSRLHLGHNSLGALCVHTYTLCAVGLRPVAPDAERCEGSPQPQSLSALTVSRCC